MAAMVLTNLMRAAVQFSLALEQLADAGDLTAEVVRAEAPTTGPDDGRALEQGRLHATTAILSGDVALDMLAWAELELRDDWPEGMTARVKPPWPRFLRQLDEHDDMRSDAAYLDLTWCLARDVLVAHQDPRLIPVPSFSGSGDITLVMATLDDERLTEGLCLLQAVQGRVPWEGRVSEAYLADPPEDPDERRTWYQWILRYTLALPSLLTARDRSDVNRAQRLAGFHSPPIHQMVPRILSLLGKHAARRELQT